MIVLLPTQKLDAMGTWDGVAEANGQDNAQSQDDSSGTVHTGIPSGLSLGQAMDYAASQLQQPQRQSHRYHRLP